MALHDVVILPVLKYLLRTNKCILIYVSWRCFNQSAKNLKLCRTFYCRIDNSQFFLKIFTFWQFLQNLRGWLNIYSWAVYHWKNQTNYSRLQCIIFLENRQFNHNYVLVHNNVTNYLGYILIPPLPTHTSVMLKKPDSVKRGLTLVRMALWAPRCRMA